MKTPHRCCVRQKAGGVYIHLVLEAGLVRQLRGIRTRAKNADIQMNVGGILACSISRTQLWPTSSHKTSPFFGQPFVVGIHCVGGRLSERCIRSLKHSTRHLVCIICDSPARAFLKQAKRHTGYHGCDYCTQNGMQVGTRMTFPSLTASVPCDSDLRTRKQNKRRTGPSLITCGVCLGLVRKVLTSLLGMEIGQKARLSLEFWNLLNDTIEQRSVIPSSDFARKCRGVGDLNRWKASELQQFLLHIEPVVLKGILHPDVYKRRMYFAVAGSNFIAILGPNHLVYKLHESSPLFSFVKSYGRLDRFSCLPYETELAHINHSHMGQNRRLFSCTADWPSA
ncbi:hypothetical protein T265_06099 [Opisthorchis viverrini]|uniref:Uncharacterized protein n=1 Tax=Opisthorchis viverrini TaxID=6198 RepID=A0A074ZHK5_OPIVI|nr:hypothetical protein T265_06099 [Opisthorchis viverrini]KER26738.1 hypothetical protein T265_06099 [Opisthorchis viverrini]